MPATRMMATDEAAELIELVRTIATQEIAPRAAQGESEAAFPRDLFRLLGRSDLLGLAYPEEFGGGGQSYEVYLQVLEEVAAALHTAGSMFIDEVDALVSVRPSD